MAAARAQLVRWGNSLAIRLPKAILEEVKMKEGEEIEIRSENGKLSLYVAEPRPSLEELVGRINARNRHGEIDWGPPQGDEPW